MSNQYYYFATGLPDFSFESTKLPYTMGHFRKMLDVVLEPEDKVLIYRYLLKYDNENLIALLKNNKAILNENGILSAHQLMEALEEAKSEVKFSNKNIPPYFADYIRQWLAEDSQSSHRIWEDLMMTFYTDYGISTKNSFVAQWFELNLNIGNILSAIYCRKYNMPIADIIVGNNEMAQIIRQNANARDFGLSAEFDYFDTLLRLSEETDIYDRERKIDKFRWDWLVEKTEFNAFGIEYIFAWLCRLQIAERWTNLNVEKGERVFREIISDLKKGVEVPTE